MASKLIEFNEAAKALGISVEQLQAMRQGGEIYGTNVGGGVWKFKQEEIDRVRAELGSGDISDDSFDHLVPKSSDDDDSDSGDDSMSILVSEPELGQSPPTSSSTIIGKGKLGSQLSAEDSDLKLSSELTLGSKKGGGSDLRLADDDDGELRLSDENDLKKSGSGTGDLLPRKKGDSGKDDDLLLSMDDDNLTLEEDGELKLDGDSDDDMVLGGSSLGSDVSLDAAGSGINLTSPSDSGLSLEDEPLELAGSQVESLGLPEDEEVFSLDNEADPDQATQLKADEEFLLSPLDDGSLDESSDSGSQVIALEDSDAFDENAATMVNNGAAPLLAEDTGDVMGPALGGFGAAGGMTASMAQQPQYIPVPMAEAPYSVMNVLGLISVMSVLSLSLMLMIDLLRNMWSWEGTASTTSSLMDGILNMLKIK